MFYSLIDIGKAFSWDLLVKSSCTITIPFLLLYSSEMGLGGLRREGIVKSRSRHLLGQGGECFEGPKAGPIGVNSRTTILLKDVFHKDRN